MAGLLRVLTTLLLLITLACSITALVLHARNKASDSPRFHETLYGLGLADAAFSILTCLVGLGLVLTRNMHRRWLTIVWLAHSFLSAIVAGATWGILAYLDAFDLLTTIFKVTLAFFVAVSFFQMVTALYYVAKSMEEYAVGHK